MPNAPSVCLRAGHGWCDPVLCTQPRYSLPDELPDVDCREPPARQRCNDLRQPRQRVCQGQPRDTRHAFPSCYVLRCAFMATAAWGVKPIRPAAVQVCSGLMQPLLSAPIMVCHAGHGRPGDDVGPGTAKGRHGRGAHTYCAGGAVVDQTDEPVQGRRAPQPLPNPCRPREARWRPAQAAMVQAWRPIHSAAN